MEFLSSQGVYSKHFTLRPLWRPSTVPQVSDFTWFDHMYRVPAHAPTLPFSCPLSLPLLLISFHSPLHSSHGQAGHGDEQPLLPLHLPIPRLSPLPGPAMQESPLRSHTWSLATPPGSPPSVQSGWGCPFWSLPLGCGSLFPAPSPPLCAAAVAAGGRWSVVGGSWRWWR